MLNFLKELRCDHEFKIIDTCYRSYIDENGIFEAVKKYILYCPKCEKEKRVYADDYERELKKKRLKKEFERRLNNEGR